MQVEVGTIIDIKDKTIAKNLQDRKKPKTIETTIPTAKRLKIH